MANEIILGDGTTLTIDSVAVGKATNIRYGGGGYQAVDAGDLSTTGLIPFMQTLSKDGGELTIEYHSTTSIAQTRGNKSIVITLPGAVAAVSFKAFFLNEENVIPMREKFSHTARMKIIPDDNPAQT